MDKRSTGVYNQIDVGVKGFNVSKEGLEMEIAVNEIGL
jgi:hypothetical protein